MRLMVIVKASEESEAGAMPTAEDLARMGKFNEEMVKAGVMLDGNGLKASSAGARIAYSGGKPTVIDGPFAETKELVAGYWIIETKSLEEAVEWLKRAPFQGGEVEIRPFHTAEDFGEAFTPEVQAQQERLTAEIAARQEK